jgi:hypothetical protein
VILARRGSGAVPFQLAVSARFLPVDAAEFPNDNPSLHRGARWICRSTVGAARAVLRPSPGAEPSVPPLVRATARVEAVPAEAAAKPEPVARQLTGPIELDLGRIVLLHRVENIPPPPDFIFQPFVPTGPAPRPAPPDASRALATEPSGLEPMAVSGAQPIEPVACQIVDRRDAARRVNRGWRVDIAPCLSIGSGAPLPSSSGETPRRATRRRGSVVARSFSPLPDSDEVSRAISELEAAFAQPALHYRPDGSAGVGSCRAGGV